ncbi:hypothetical protein I316_05278 [Kwoniella heveanensis BCC8398]|uniref:DUF7719 domain-containing protein n=1 Tax=Kwoniella heveanensis BCC8398 TaxID=1296120 RepID=A0A1B9GPK7_9TREE|nr:hypothetical protein I316_05278 [Kwoniella heveanensis BCC8398]
MAIVEDLEDDVADPSSTSSASSKLKPSLTSRASTLENAEAQDGMRNRSRGNKFSADTHPDIPLAHPSVARQSGSGSTSSTAGISSQTPLVSISDLGLDPDLMRGTDLSESNSNVFTLKPGEEIPEHLLSSLHPLRGGVTGAGEEEVEVEVDEVFNTLILAIPFSFLYLLLDILVHLQYSHRPTWGVLAKHLITAIPTNRHPTHFATNPLLMASSIGSGCRLMWLVNKGSWSVVTEQAPSMGTLWILTIVQLPLSRAMIALAAVGGWLWYSGMKLIP